MNDGIGFAGTAAGLVVGIIIAAVFIVHPDNGHSASGGGSATAATPSASQPSAQSFTADPKAAGLLKYVQKVKGFDMKSRCLYIVRVTAHGVKGSTDKIKVTMRKSTDISRHGQRVDVAPIGDVALTGVQLLPNRKKKGVLWVAYKDGGVTGFSDHHLTSVTVCAVPTAALDSMDPSGSAAA